MGDGSARTTQSTTTTWVEVSATVPSSHVGSLTIHMGEWMFEADIQSGNVRHLVPPPPAAPDMVTVPFTVPARHVTGFYAELASWWRQVDEHAARDD